MNKDIELEILNYNYWEHFKFVKDIALILPITHPKRIRMEIELNELIDRIHKLKNNDERHST
jgi:hypothetical protein